MSHNNVFLNSKYASGFSPQVIPGLTLWLDAADQSTMTLSGSSVTTWRDKSGNGYNATVTSGANAPILSGNSIQFRAASSQSLDIAQGFGTSLVDTTLILFFVGQRVTASGFHFFLSGATTDNNRVMQTGFFNDNMSLNIYSTEFNTAIPAYSASAEPTRIYSYALNTATAEQVMNGTTLQSTAGTYRLAGFLGPQLGRRYSGVNIAYHSFNISEMIGFAPIISVAQRQVVEGYLAWKWGLVGNLPTAHPYRTAPIFTRPFNPLDIAGCALWLDAADYRTFTFSSGSNVSEWRDKSGLGQILSSQTATGAVASNFNGRASLYFGRAPWYRTTGFALSNTQGTAWFTVYATTGNISTSGSILLVGGSNIERFIRQDVTNQAQISTFHPPVQRITSDAGALNTPALYNFVDTPSALTVFKNGSQIFNANTAVTYATNTKQTLQIGYYNDYLLGHIFELLIYDSPLSTAQRQQVEVYLAEKWGLRSSLSTSNALRLFRALSPVFNPTLISGCSLWLDAGDRTTFTFSSGSNVSQWNDKSGNGYSVIQPTVSNQPTLTSAAQNTLSGIQLQSNLFLYQSGTTVSNFSTGASTSLFVAARNASANTGWNVISTIWFNAALSGATERYHFSFNNGSSPGPTLYLNSALIGRDSNNVVAPNSNAIIGFTGSSTSVTLHTNGSSNSYAGATIPNVNSSTLLIIGDNRNNSTVSSNSMMFEMVGFNVQLTNQQRQVIEGYLAWKWGLVGNLPSAHPYKSIKP